MMMQEPVVGKAEASFEAPPQPPIEQTPEVAAEATADQSSAVPVEGGDEGRDAQNTNQTQETSEGSLLGLDALTEEGRKEIHDNNVAELIQEVGNLPWDEVEGLITTNIDAQLEEGGITPEEHKKSKERLDKFKERAALLWGQEWKNIQDMAKQSDLKTFLDNFFSPYTPEGGSSPSVGRESLQGSVGDEVLMDEIENGPAYLVAAIKSTFGNKGLNENIGFLGLDDNAVINDVNKLKTAIRYFNQKAADENNWPAMQKGLSKFCDPTESTTYLFSDKTKILFRQLDGMDATAFKKYFHIT